jgi:hypothetical protein
MVPHTAPWAAQLVGVHDTGTGLAGIVAKLKISTSGWPPWPMPKA